ncbi:unnamed protein product [Caenorhabditis angaria]|uniref:Thioredoxin domain-containing protein n=1 Tax=Caenorhabditis angaria TaxID=860376 RepID=A0A9P1N4J3_9PELO|nr:unnamed protein product [Caenorhabditis angaria]
MIHIENAKHFDQIFDAKKPTKPIFAYFKAEWSNPCQRISPKIAEFAEKYARYFQFLEIDVDQNEGITERFDVYCTPTFLLLQNGRVIKTLTGTNQEEIEKMLDIAKLQSKILKPIVSQYVSDRNSFVFDRNRLISMISFGSRKDYKVSRSPM